MTNVNSVSSNRKKNVEKRFWLSVAFSVVAIFLCLAALCASTYALFQKSATSTGNVVRTAVYVLNFQWDTEEPAHISFGSGEGHQLSKTFDTAGNHTLTITYLANEPGNASTGFVTITVVDAHGNRTLHTVHLGTTENAVTSITLNINVLTAGGSITFAPQWGTSTDQNPVGDDATIELGHKLVHHEAQAPTCTEKGWNAYDTCELCSYSTYVEIPATGHTPAAAVEENRVEATCTAAGSYDSVVYCSVCGAELSRTQQTIPALGHAWGEWSETTAPTCTTAGQKSRECSRCHEIETETIPALGHDFGEWTQTTAPTCTEAGEETRTCSRCGATETREVAALGHDFGEWVVTTPATCTEAGEETRTCSRCNATETRPVDALGHNMTAHAAVDATCTTAGNSAYWSCDRCNK